MSQVQTAKKSLATASAIFRGGLIGNPKLNWNSNTLLHLLHNYVFPPGRSPMSKLSVAYVSKLSKKTKQSLIAACCSGLFLRCRAGAPGCGRTHTSSGPPRAPPHGCPGWSAAGPASPASHVRAPAARRSTPSLKYQTGETFLIPLGLLKDSCKG